ncbi:hypothetical protein Q4Q39_17445 [Flavivirga amylovorans]|uniref:Uncharacterized protein n=1 Tax=Flavivirga amylovorans TaxID=870486 RepID=A0ABT8X5F2_9FLAO|nr:hypothetical protein [Flavivirga amylovorans]MDO5989192.1 hypothetical protein [Flavivirga amylovorans]
MENYEYEVTGFDKNPVLKKLMIDYVKYNYEENADISDYNLWQEYNYLKNNAMLDILFECERRGVLTEQMRLEDESFQL